MAQGSAISEISSNSPPDMSPESLLTDLLQDRFDDTSFSSFHPLLMHSLPSHLPMYSLPSYLPMHSLPSYLPMHSYPRTFPLHTFLILFLLTNFAPIDILLTLSEDHIFF